MHQLGRFIALFLSVAHPLPAVCVVCVEQVATIVRTPSKSRDKSAVTRNPAYAHGSEGTELTRDSDASALTSARSDDTTVEFTPTQTNGHQAGGAGAGATAATTVGDGGSKA